MAEPDRTAVARDEPAPAHDGECRRLRVLADMCDERTIQHLLDVGVGDGWCCLEAGAGAGSVARWLAGRVGAGTVVATDIDTRCMDVAEAENIEVVRHDLTVDPRPGGPFDLIHTRALLVHLPMRDQVLDRLASWLRPGGWLVLEELFILPAMISPPLVARYFAALAAVLAEHLGTDSQWALTLPGPLLTRGFVETGGRVHIPSTARSAAASTERSPAIEFLYRSLEQIRRSVTGMGLLTDQEVDRVVDLLRGNDPSVITYGFGFVSAWGRRG